MNLNLLLALNLNPPEPATPEQKETMIILNNADMGLLICDADMEDADMRLMIWSADMWEQKNTPYHFIGMGYKFKLKR